MINIYVAVGILFLHWVFDFVLQTDKQGKDKSSKFDVLSSHALCYTLLWFPPTAIYAITTNAPEALGWFIPITFFCHIVTDYYTSRVGKQLLKEAETTNDHHNFFVNIGFDQWLHQAQLLITFYLLT